MVPFYFCILALGLCASGQRVEQIRDHHLRQTVNDVEKLLLKLRNENKGEETEATREVLTYNLGMTPSTPKYRTRKLQIPKVMSRVKADIVCLQEVHFIEDQVALLDSVADKYKYKYTFAHSEVSTFDDVETRKAPCPEWDPFSDVLVCLIENCQSKENVKDKIACAIYRCDLLRLTQSCVSCISASGANPEDTLNCANNDNSIDPVGLIVLSNEKPVNARMALYKSTTGTTKPFQRGYIELELHNEQTFYCTQLCADYDVENHASIQTSHNEHRESDIDELLERVEIDHGDSVILGTLNIGPPSNTDAADSALQKLVSHHFSSALTADMCTKCESNPLVQQCEACQQNGQVDFLLLHGHFKSSNVKRLFEENLKGLKYPLSDHYGVKAKIWCEAPHEHDRRINY